MCDCPECRLEAERRRVGASRLLSRGGYQVYSGLLDPAWLAGLGTEALAGARWADAQSPGHDHEQVRGGTPARELTSVDGGPMQQALLASPALQQFIANEVGLPILPHGSRASYSIYEGAQAHLGLHRDIVGCDLALITCLADRPGGHAALQLWPDDPCTPLGRIRAGGGRGSSTVSLAAGESLLLHGGLIPHRAPPAGSARTRIVSLICFRIVA